jgi:hypothetical protein
LDSRVIDHTEIGIANDGIRSTENGMIQGILRLKTHFELHLFMTAGQSKVLHDRCVIRQAKGTAYVPDGVRRIAESVCGWNLKDARISKVVVDPIGVGPSATARCAYNVGSLGTVRPYGRSSILDCELKREAAPQAPDASGLPTTENKIDGPRRRIQEGFPAPEWQLIGVFIFACCGTSKVERLRSSTAYWDPARRSPS